MSGLLSRLAQVTGQSIERLRVRSAINPALWLAGITGLFGLVGTILTQPPAQNWMLVFMFFGAGVAVLQILIFTFRDPGKLRSEDFELRRTALAMIEEQGSDIPIEPTSVQAITNVEYSHEAKKQGGILE